MENTNELRQEILELAKKYSREQLFPQNFVPGKTKIAASSKSIGEEEIAYIIDAALDGWLTSGRFNDLFEKKIGQFLGIEHVLTVNSGSSANLVAFNTLTSEKLGDRRIKKNDEIISVAAGFPTTVNPIIQFGAIPVFVDVELGTYNVRESDIESAITKKTKGIMLAHTLGNPYNLERIVSICRKYKLWLIEDCCDAFGSKFNGQFVGTFGDLATLSFYPAHHITTGEGGAVITGNEELRKIAESIRDWGRDCYCPPGQENTCTKRFCWKLGNLPKGYDHKYIYSHVGYNLKITDMQAACGLAQIDKLSGFIEKRKENFAYLLERLKSCQEFFMLPKKTAKSDPSWFGFPVTLNKNAPVDRLDLLTYLEQQNVGTRLLFAGNLTKQPYMENIKYRIAGNLKNTDHIMTQTFWLGVHPGLTTEMLDYMVEKIENYLGINF